MAWCVWHLTLTKGSKEKNCLRRSERKLSTSRFKVKASRPSPRNLMFLGKRLDFAKLHVKKSQSFLGECPIDRWGKNETYCRGTSALWSQTQKISISKNNTAPTVKHGGGSVMFWDFFDASGTGCLKAVQRTIKTHDYWGKLDRNVLASVRKLGSYNWTTTQNTAKNY